MIKLNVYIGAADHNIQFMERWLTSQCAGYTSVPTQGHWKDSEGISWMEEARLFIFVVDDVAAVQELLVKIEEFLRDHSEEQEVLFDYAEVKGGFIKIKRNKPVASPKGCVGWVVGDWKI